MALAANIETRGWKHQYNIENGIPPKHPQASTTDNVECFFSVLGDNVGKDFTLKEVNTKLGSVVSIVYILYIQVFYGWRKVTNEFLKRMDPDLPFYYHTSTHTRFYEGVMPTFDTNPSKRPQKKRIPRYELLWTNNRVTMAVRSARAQFHNVPLELYLFLNIHTAILQQK